MRVGKMTDNFTALIFGDEDARVCKDIPEAACKDTPHNFFAYLGANVLGKIADEIASAKLVIPWLFASLGVPIGFTGMLVPIREAGILIPQLVVAAAVRHKPKRKGVWLLGAILSALSLLGMAIAALFLEGGIAGIAITGMLIIFSLSRGICSVSAKDVLGKTVSKSRRGILMGMSAGLSGVVVLAIGSWLAIGSFKESEATVFAILLATGGILWLGATLIFSMIREQPGATEGGGNALEVAIRQMKLIVDDTEFRRYLITRSLLLCIALAPPFYVLVAQQQSDTALLGLGALIIANGLATTISAPVWGYLGDRSSRQVMMLASTGAGLLAVYTVTAVWLQWHWATSELGLAAIFFVLNVMHGGVRLGRKVYLVDMANADNRAAYVAVSNTVIGLLMLAGGLLGLVGQLIGATATVGILGIGSFIAAIYAHTLADVSEPD